MQGRSFRSWMGRRVNSGWGAGRCMSMHRDIKRSAYPVRRHGQGITNKVPPECVCDSLVPRCRHLLLQ
eukprot:3743383-Rhodomonas_salina.7